MSLMVVGAVGTTVGAGTFASFTTNDTNPAAFASGTVILSNTGPSATTCVSTGGTEAGGTVTSGNNNDTCDVMFVGTTATAAASSKRPGESASVIMHLKDVGTVSGTLSVVSAAACTDSDPASHQASPYGTVQGCDTVQLAIEDGSTCYWGDNMGTAGTKPFITGAALTYPVDITTGSNDRFKITVDGVVQDNLALTAGSYASAAAFAAQINSKISSWATATTVGNSIKIESLTSVSGSNVSLNIPTTTPLGTGLVTMGFIDGSSAAGPGRCATKTGDRTHTLEDFRTTTGATPLALGSLTSGATRDFTVTLSVPSVITSSMQARTVGFEMTWKLTA